MKIYFTVLVALLMCQIQIKGQIVEEDENGGGSKGEEVKYSYDAAGNRISRSIITVSGNPKTLEGEEEDDKGDEKLNPKGGLQECEILVYPNPVREEFTIEIWKGNDEENYRFLLFDMTGKLITEHQQHGNGLLPFDMSVYPRGIYLLIIETGDDKREFKIIKE